MGVAAVSAVALLITANGCGRKAEERAPEGVTQSVRPEPRPENPQPAVPAQLEGALPESELSSRDVVPSRLPVYELKMDRKNLARLEQSAFSNDTVPASLTIDTNTFADVLVRYRGAWARSWPKKPMKIFFNREHRFAGQRCLNLNSGWHDPALIRECLAYHIYRACGAPASRARMVRLNLNGQFRGVYVEVQQPDQSLLKDLNLKGAAVYKAASRNNQADERDHGSEAVFRRHYEKQTRESESYSDLQQFCRDLASAPNVLEFFTRQVDLERYVNYLAATALVQNWDGYNKNHYLVHDLDGSGKWFVVPWDLDRTLGDHWRWSFDEARLSPLLGIRSKPGVTGWNRLQDRFFSEPALKARFVTRLKALLETEFTEAKLFPIIDRLQAEMGDDAALDRRRWPGGNPDVAGGLEQVKGFIRERRAFLLAELDRL